jgi:prepilin-type N-terminal cleavage/methylation domain-containing protein
MIEQRKRNRGQGGFTLIELLVVIAILAILAGVAVFAVGGLRSDAGSAACKTEYDTVRTAVAAAEASADKDTDGDGTLDPDSWVDFIQDGSTKYWTVNASDEPAVKDPAPAKGMTANSTNRNDCDNIS